MHLYFSFFFLIKAVGVKKKIIFPLCLTFCFVLFIKEWLEVHNHCDAIVDGANVGLYQQNFADSGFNLSQVVKYILVFVYTLN